MHSSKLEWEFLLLSKADGPCPPTLTAMWAPSIIYVNRVFLLSSFLSPVFCQLWALSTHPLLLAWSRMFECSHHDCILELDMMGVLSLASNFWQWPLRELQLKIPLHPCWALMPGLMAGQEMLLAEIASRSTEVHLIQTLHSLLQSWLFSVISYTCLSNGMNTAD